MRQIDQIKSDVATVYIDITQKLDIACTHLFENEMLNEPIDAFPDIKSVGIFDFGVKIGFMFANVWTKKTCSVCGEIHYDRMYYYRPVVESAKAFKTGKKTIVQTAITANKTKDEIKVLVDEYTANFDKSYIQNWTFDLATKNFILKPVNP